ncbi:hypothetical protein CLF_104203 [Clonorchis sinensis]|uniref:Uncharacterized protein n=1 Tax=Clonorchis sinensis TaxID=79923 RepID=G7YNT1_CLOSI|nr:hypothetical protein CLF_104203 [Clonorchis sinensis]
MLSCDFSNSPNDLEVCFKPRKPVYLTVFSVHTLEQTEHWVNLVRTLDALYNDVRCISETGIQDSNTLRMSGDAEVLQLDMPVCLRYPDVGNKRKFPSVQIFPQIVEYKRQQYVIRSQHVFQLQSGATKVTSAAQFRPSTQLTLDTASMTFDCYVRAVLLTCPVCEIRMNVVSLVVVILKVYCTYEAEPKQLLVRRFGNLHFGSPAVVSFFLATLTRTYPRSTVDHEVCFQILLHLISRFEVRTYVETCLFPAENRCLASGFSEPRRAQTNYQAAERLPDLEVRRIYHNHVLDYSNDPIVGHAGTRPQGCEEGLQNPGIQIITGESLVDLDHSDGTVRVFEEEKKNPHYARFEMLQYMLLIDVIGVSVVGVYRDCLDDYLEKYEKKLHEGDSQFEDIAGCPNLCGTDSEAFMEAVKFAFVGRRSVINVFYGVIFRFSRTFKAKKCLLSEILGQVYLHSILKKKGTADIYIFLRAFEFVNLSPVEKEQIIAFTFTFHTHIYSRVIPYSLNFALCEENLLPDFRSLKPSVSGDKEGHDTSRFDALPGFSFSHLRLFLRRYPSETGQFLIGWRHAYVEKVRLPNGVGAAKTQKTDSGLSVLLERLAAEKAGN